MFLINRWGFPGTHFIFWSTFIFFFLGNVKGLILRILGWGKRSDGESIADFFEINTCIRVSLAVFCLSIHVDDDDINHSKGDSLLLAFPSLYHVNALWYLAMFHTDITRSFHGHGSSIRSLDCAHYSNKRFVHRKVPTRTRFRTCMYYDSLSTAVSVYVTKPEPGALEPRKPVTPLAPWGLVSELRAR